MFDLLQPNPDIVLGANEAGKDSLECSVAIWTYSFQKAKRRPGMNPPQIESCERHREPLSGTPPTCSIVSQQYHDASTSHNAPVVVTT